MKIRQRVSALIQSLANTALVTAFIAFAAQSARADDAAKFLKAMTDYTAAQKSISATFDSDIEVVTPELEKIQFTSSGKLQLTRPDKLRISRTGGYTDVQLVYDGKTVSIYNLNYYWFVGYHHLTASHLERTVLDIQDRILKGYNQRWAGRQGAT